MRGQCILVVCCLILQAVSRCEALSGRTIANTARSYIGETRWSESSNYQGLRGQPKCNIFVADVVSQAGGSVPRRYGVRGIIGAGEWGSRWSFYLGVSPCWKNFDRPQIGDVIGYGGHVGIMTGPGKTTSAAQYRVVENNWGFRSGQSPVYWRYIC
ncbi:hypothetical protein SNE40_017076 [Patella caerulea]|uniref:Uncharacterized protein n=1 Tax=Patella caerulea TaxID=87958 RepID=A0AAN8JB87_PATCE